MRIGVALVRMKGAVDTTKLVRSQVVDWQTITLA
jgi:hypothetical protein